ncbi:hypothetical protein BDF14DRAFT_36062 [Spinellus fusiger]|nr:hypothetical protein BDF14DRAFT_36062 [Spinellus fusiger]
MKFTCIALFVAVLVASVSAGGSSDQAVNDVGNEGRVGGLVCILCFCHKIMVSNVSYRSTTFSREESSLITLLRMVLAKPIKYITISSIIFPLSHSYLPCYEFIAGFTILIFFNSMIINMKNQRVNMKKCYE